MGQTHLTLFVRSIPEALVIPHLHAMQNWDVYFFICTVGSLVCFGLSAASVFDLTVTCHSDSSHRQKKTGIH